MAFWKKNKNEDGQGYVPGLTPRSFFATLICMLLTAMYVQYSKVIVDECYMIPESAIPIPAMIVIVALLVFVGVFGLLFKIRILTKAEIVCVAFATLMSVPLMTQGFWMRFLGVTSAPLRNQNFDYMDAYNDNLWPHGPNLLADAFAVAAPDSKNDGNGEIFVTPGSTSKNITWSEVEYEEGVKAILPTITNTGADEETYLSFTIPVSYGDKPSTAVPSYPHLASILALTPAVEAETQIFARALADDNPVPVDLITGRKADKKTYLHKKGFVRLGQYGVIPAPVCASNLVIQIGLKGRGSVTFADPKLMSVFALESAFTGRKIMPEKEYLALAPAARPAGVIVKPDNLWSIKGLTYFIKGYIPIREWIRPAVVWGSYLLMLYLAFFTINVMMRKKWAESERYPMPNAKIPLAIIGVDDKKESPFAEIWKNPYAWAGLIFAVLFGIARGAHYYNPNLPDLDASINIGEYVTNPVYGEMFKTTFYFSLFVCSIAVFFELNVLISVVVGYWFFRACYCFGHLGGIDVNAGFPWRYEQSVGSYLGYFFVVIALSAKYIWGIVKDAAKGTKKEHGEVFSSRMALVLFILSHVGIIIWAKVMNANVGSMLLMFCFLVLIGFVSAKYRAECGSPWGYFTPYNSMLFVSMCGGIALFGTSSMMISLILSGFLTVTVFYLIPGLQFEVIQIGKRMNIQPRHIMWVCLLGLLGGLFIGGWVFLSNAYSYGGDNIKYQWPFNGLNWFMNKYRTILNEATADWLRQTADPTASLGPDWGFRAMCFGGVIMVVLTILRQFFAGFWFHPIGFLLAPTHLNDGANWGTLLIAWLIRMIVLKVGGAHAVRTKLQPFFVGAFVGCLIAIVIFTIVNAQARMSGSTLFYPSMP